MQDVTNSHNDLADEITLRNLMAQYCDAVTRNDSSRWIDCWSQDAQWNLLGNTVCGKEAILTLFQQMMTGFEFALMIPGICQFEVNGDSATGYWYLQEFTRDSNGNGSSLFSRYEDSYIKQEGNWKYQRRSYQILYSGEALFTGAFPPAKALDQSPNNADDVDATPENANL
ncbi:nuclear transport factor 2 family protein [Microbulbifer agarilyticus]|uniref:nuclear transport factor 2 family protein n=1 Tax=Microbulbifer agarilyticus TaxID=260552 RepID=UPI001C94A9DA|nr:nuclear transport factor 2 family protein [Microbulbifer agarilyticus]MBY6211199.1 nuclear transport factor 2 family protein [Microbulbifer agarilyticus]